MGSIPNVHPFADKTPLCTVQVHTHREIIRRDPLAAYPQTISAYPRAGDLVGEDGVLAVCGDAAVFPFVCKLLAGRNRHQALVDPFAGITAPLVGERQGAPRSIPGRAFRRCVRGQSGQITSSTVRPWKIGWNE